MAEEAKTEAAEKTKSCFVACPIGKEGTDTRRRTDNLLKKLIRPILEPRGYQVTAAHNIRQPGMITTDIVRCLIDSDLVVADLTDLNPNVMYEVGIRHATRRRCIVVARSGEALPFDFHNFRTVFIDYHHWDGPEKAMPEFGEHVEGAEAEQEGEAPSPVSEALLSARLLAVPANGVSQEDRVGALAKVVMELRDELRLGRHAPSRSFTVSGEQMDLLRRLLSVAKAEWPPGAGRWRFVRESLDQEAQVSGWSRHHTENLARLAERMLSDAANQSEA